MQDMVDEEVPVYDEDDSPNSVPPIPSGSSFFIFSSTNP